MQLEIVKRLLDIQKQIEELGKQSVVVGIPKKSGTQQNEDGTNGITLSKFAMIHEFGAPKAGIPERSFLRTTASEEVDNVKRLAVSSISKLVNGDISVSGFYGTIGSYLQGQVRRKLLHGTFTPLKPATIARKGSDKPLIDTGALLQAITHEVRDE